MTPRKAYFVGIGGIGMSALAQMMQDHGTEVSGSDRETSPTTDLLASRGIAVATVQKADNVPEDAEVVIYSEAVPEENPERVRARGLEIPEFSYFEMLGKVSAGKKTVAVSGTHGKTTTTGMLARILRDAGASPSAVVGSIVRDFGSNYLHGDSDLFAVEACEYKNDFRFLTPHIFVVTNIEWDHTDFYPDLASVQNAFRGMMEKVPATGAIVTNVTHPHIAPLLGGLVAPVIDYTKESEYGIQLPGEFNEMNARAAAAAARASYPAITDEEIKTSLHDFLGIWRRFEYKGKTKNGVAVYDDYAHHPTAVRETLKAMRATFPSHHIVVAFHPHLYSRTRDLMEDFAQAFHDADEVIVAPIYPAREKPIKGVTAEVLAEKISATGTNARAASSLAEVESLLAAYCLLPTAHNLVIMTMGAGDIYKVANALI